MTNRYLFNSILVLVVLSVPVYIFMFVNTGVSLKYETNDVVDCISLVTGSDLCLASTIIKTLIGSSLLIMIGMLYFREKIIK